MLLQDGRCEGHSWVTYALVLHKSKCSPSKFSVLQKGVNMLDFSPNQNYLLVPHKPHCTSVARAWYSETFLPNPISSLIFLSTHFTHSDSLDATMLQTSPSFLVPCIYSVAPSSVVSYDCTNKRYVETMGCHGRAKEDIPREASFSDFDQGIVNNLRRGARRTVVGRER